MHVRARILHIELHCHSDFTCCIISRQTVPWFIMKLCVREEVTCESGLSDIELAQKYVRMFVYVYVSLPFNPPPDRSEAFAKSYETNR